MNRALCIGLALCVSGFTCETQTYEGRTLSSWMRDLESRQEYERRRACQVIENIGPAAAEAVPILIKRLGDDSSAVQDSAENALANIGKLSVPHLEPLLDTHDPVLRCHAAIALVRIDPQHGAAMEKLITSLTAVGFPEVAGHAKDAAVDLGEIVVPHLLPHIGDPFKPVREQILETLYAMRHAAKAAIPKVAEVGKAEPDPELRKQFVRTLARLGTKDDVEASLRLFMEDPDETVAATVNNTLVHIGAIERPAAVYADPVASPAARGSSASKKPLRSLLSEPTKRE